MVVAKLAFGLAAACVCMTGVRAGGDEVCRPALAFKDVTTTEMLRPPASGRLWFAVVAVDASACAAAPGGSFEIVFSRLKENAPDLEFREEFVWAAPAVQVGLHVAADEAVDRYRFDRVEPCACAPDRAARLTPPR